MADKDNKEIKKATVEKKPGFFSRLPGRVSKWFREMRSELKKVSWPTFPQVVNNTGIVLMSILIVGAVVIAFDYVWGLIVQSIVSIRL